ncbi:MAG: response regulator transcription factor [Bacteroidales bacterium]|jgi:DNA-binding response OmpR family regulator|nr:response regulator transcription factor [Bacteroidales bacterium]MDD3167067.1 response regulator transcription factor [Bacteroidales bacterium]MDD4770752.1 response regulator transcription factor [Bacteroidales bacterium]
MKLLVVEDQDSLRQGMVEQLTELGYRCESAATFETGLEKIDLYRYDVAVIDINLPDGNGLDLIRMCKSVQPDAGIIVVSARNALEQKIEGLEVGADDYLTKPFDMAELSARIKSILRRRISNGSNLFVSGSFTVDFDTRILRCKGQELDLTKSEYDLIVFLMSNPNRVMTKESLAEHIWGDHMDLADSFDFLYSHIKNIRKKIAGYEGGDPIKSVYGIGYKWIDV